MTLQEFIDKYTGKYVEYGGSQDAINQCTDLANAYIDQVLCLPIILWTDAKDFPSKGGNNYEYIKNTPEIFPQAGDIIIWGGTYGHIAICVSGDVKSVVSFDQNYPLGSPCKLVTHNYTNVLGWMRAKAKPMETYNGIDLTNIESVKVCVDFWARWARDGGIAEIQKQLVDANNARTEADLMVNKLALQNTTLIDNNKQLKEDVSCIQADNKTLQGELERVRLALSDYYSGERDLSKRILSIINYNKLLLEELKVKNVVEDTIFTKINDFIKKMRKWLKK